MEKKRGNLSSILAFSILNGFVDADLLNNKINCKNLKK